MAMVFPRAQRDGRGLLRNLFCPSVRHGTGISGTRGTTRRPRGARRPNQGFPVGLRRKSIWPADAESRAALEYSRAGTKGGIAYQGVADWAGGLKRTSAPR